MGVALYSGLWVWLSTGGCGCGSLHWAVGVALYNGLLEGEAGTKPKVQSLVLYKPGVVVLGSQRQEDKKFKV